jgi:predicted transcriptional regulator
LGYCQAKFKKHYNRAILSGKIKCVYGGAVIAAIIMRLVKRPVKAEDTAPEALEKAGQVGMQTIPVLDNDHKVIGALDVHGITSLASNGDEGLKSLRAGGFLKRDIVCIGPDAGIGDIMDMFDERGDGLEAVFVVDNENRLLGVVTRMDCIYMENGHGPRKT